MAENRYYILPMNVLNTFECDDIVEKKETVRISLDGNYFICKSKIDGGNLKSLEAYKSYTNSEIRLELSKDLWTKEELN